MNESCFKGVQDTAMHAPPGTVQIPQDSLQQIGVEPEHTASPHGAPATLVHLATGHPGHPPAVVVLCCSQTSSAAHASAAAHGSAHL
mmetsp:Transcript_67406/g.107057  ORF Transcript_67406/g.107057 Transcript_67406/m.107057 type:complete len:87 (+) Transcript_67406:101-361(+)